MAYTTKSLVKKECVILETDTSYDTDLDAAIALADSYIDLKCSEWGLDVPFDICPDIIQEASTAYASGIIKRRIAPVGTVIEEFTVADNKIMAYINGQKRRATFIEC